MKKLLSLLCVIVCLLSVCSCKQTVLATEGINESKLASFSPLFSCDGKTYMKYSGAEKDEYIEIGDESFSLVRGDTDSMNFSIKKTGNSAAVYVKVIEGRNLEEKCSSQYKEFFEKLQKKLKKNKNYECIVVKIDDNLYGAVNCYNRTGGDDGDKFMIENFEKSYLVTYEKNRVKLSKKNKDMAILAVNDKFYIGRSDLTFYSVNRETEEKTQLFKDRWYSFDAGHNNSVATYFTDENFIINGVIYEDERYYESTIACKIDGSCVRLIVNNKRI